MGITDRDESTGGVCCTDAGTRVARTGCVERRENINHIGTLDHITIYERSEDKFKLVGKGKHNVSYNTTDNNTIISHLSINKYSKTNSNPKKERVKELEKKTVMSGIPRLETKLLKILQKRKLLVRVNVKT